MQKYFIDMIMKKIWEDETILFNSHIRKCEKMTEEELVEQCKKDINDLNEKVFSTQNHSLTILETCGCKHQINNRILGGCSFCNWESERMAETARLYYLRKYYINSYSEIVRFSFEKIRGERISPEIIEQISVHDIFDEWQFPNYVFNQLFVENPVYCRNAYIGIISARASSISKEKIDMWKKVYRKGLTIGIGVECGNEWIRNHWLNKDILDSHIMNAIEVVHKSGTKACANILLGMPGLSDECSFEIFKDTLQFVEKCKFDYILISPLINKKNTLGWVYDSNNATISEKLLYNALHYVSEIDQSIQRKITFSPDNFLEMKIIINSPELDLLYSKSECLKTVFTQKEINFQKQILSKYISLKSAEKEKIKNNMYEVINKVSNNLELGKLTDIFKEELMSW